MSKNHYEETKMPDTNILITYEIFERHINDICRIQEIRLAINNACNKYNQEGKDSADVCLPSLESNLVELLEMVTDDEDKWIDYWVCELDRGERFEIGNVTIDDKPVLLKTVQDLWAMLNGKPHFVKEEYQKEVDI